MTDENWTDEDDRSLADLLGFDPSDERADDVPDALGARLRTLFTEAIGDEPAYDFSPLAVIAAARRESDTAARVARRDRERADFARRRRRSTVTKGLLIAAAAAIVVVAVPTLFSAGSSDTASNSAGVTTAAAEVSAEAGSDSAGGPVEAVTSAASSEPATSAAATAATSASESPPEVPAPAATVPQSMTTAPSVAPQTGRGLSEQATAGGSESNGGGVTESAPSSTAAADSGSATCVWPALEADAVAAALRALDLPESTPVRQPVRAVCASGQVGAVTIPSARVTVLVAADPALTADPRYSYTTKAATSTGDGISVLVFSDPARDSTRAELTAAQRLEVARAVLAALR